MTLDINYLASLANKPSFTPTQTKRIRWWIEMLRSGKYKQLDGGLKGLRYDARLGHCCLGVACELYGTVVGGQWIGVESWQEFVPDFDGDDPIDPEARTLPPQVRMWLGLSPQHYRLLARFNDDGVPFSQIADVLERWIS